MRITPRKHEVAEVVELLEQEHESPEALAKVLIKTVMNQAEARDWFALAWRPFWPTPLTLSYGPFSVEAEAKKGLARLSGGQALVVKLLSVTGLPDPDVTVSDQSKCTTCGHPQVAHGGQQKAGAHGCVVPRCKCKILTTGEAQ